jgi:phosphate transport system substrate-binding protein
MKRPFCNSWFGRKQVVFHAVTVSLALLLNGCGSKQGSAGAIAGKVVIKGSNTIGEELAPRLIAEYKKEQPDVTIDLESKGTASGFNALLSGECDVAGASRVVNHQELEQAHSKRIEFNVYTIGSYSVAVVLNAANTLTNLSRDQVRDLFTGAIQNWKDIGGPDAPVQPYIRDPISGTFLGFKELAMENKDYAANAKALTNYAAIVQAVGKDTNGIGYASFDLITKPGVKSVAIRGVAPTALTVNEGQYPVSRLLRFYTSKGKESAASRDFLRFVQSPKGQEIIEQAGYVRLF